MDYKDYYKTLGLERKATPAEIKKAYRRLARELHPDRNPGDKKAEARFKEINEAHEVLADPKKREQYDLLGSNWEQMSRAGGGAGGAGAAGNPFGGDPFGPGGPFAGYGAAGRRAGAGGGGGGNVRYEFNGAGSDDFSDFFRMFFSGADAAGATRTAAQTRKSPPAGGGTGGPTGAPGGGPAGSGNGGRRSSRPFEDLFSRLRSDGAGAGTATGAPGARPGPTPRSRGTRRGDDVDVEVDLSLEEAFHGSARLVQVGERRLEVKLPAGVETGSKIRLSGKAGSGPDAGDLYLITKILPHPVFTRNGADLTRELPITLGEALLGGEVEVETLRGRVVLTVPPGTQQGQTFRLAGQGMPRLKGDVAGDLFARIKVVMPGKLEGRQRTAAEDFLRQIVQPNPRNKL
jgi:DnaJ-class molecular chaperone